MNFFLPFWESQRTGREGGGTSLLGQIPNFDQKFVLGAPLIFKSVVASAAKLLEGNALCALKIAFGCRKAC